MSWLIFKKESDCFCPRDKCLITKLRYLMVLIKSGVTLFGSFHWSPMASFTLVLFVVFTIFSVQSIIVNWQWSKVACCWHHHQVRRFFCYHFKDWLEQCMFPWVCSFQTEISKKMMYNILMLRAKLSSYTKCHDFS